MDIRWLDPPHSFKVGVRGDIHIQHCADIALSLDEQVTFVTPSGTEYDVVRKAWGYYATPSINGRLKEHGLCGVLVKNAAGRLYLLLVEEGKKQEFHEYLFAEKQDILCWLDNEQSVNKVLRISWDDLVAGGQRKCPQCNAGEWDTVFVYMAPPAGETPFLGLTKQDYRRSVLRCRNCGHFLADLSADLSDFYRSAYLDATYRGGDLLSAYDRIMSLPLTQSDNYHRVVRITKFMAEHSRWQRRRNKQQSVLDVGSGLCVFLARMKQEGWSCMALDLDLRAVEHAQKNVQVSAVCADFSTYEALDRYDLITFNRVLEHVADPVVMLARCKNMLEREGVVYIEVPDGELAAAEGPDREEFFIEHLHVFSVPSLSLLAFRAGFNVLEIKRIREPSGKFTLYAFLTQSPSHEMTIIRSSWNENPSH